MIEPDTPLDDALPSTSHPPPGGGSTGVWLAALAVAVGVAILALQIVTLQTAGGARSAAADAGATAAEAAGRLGAIQGEMKALADQVDELESDLASARFEPSVDAGDRSSPNGTQGLPPYPGSGADPAVQASMRLPAVTGDEYYSGERITVAADGDRATAWLIWAHWCPHCQRELPDLAEFWSVSAEDYPHVRVVTVSSAIDEARGNPLTAYLEDSQFPFPVLVDESGSLAATFGTTAFPFWVITGPDGRVLFRQPGAFGADQLAGLFTSVEEFVGAG